MRSTHDNEVSDSIPVKVTFLFCILFNTASFISHIFPILIGMQIIPTSFPASNGRTHGAPFLRPWFRTAEVRGGEGGGGWASLREFKYTHFPTQTHL